MTGTLRVKAGPVMEAAGAALLVVAFAVEVLQQQPRWVMRFSLGAAVVLIVAAALSDAVRRAWLAALCGLALILSVSQLVRMTEEPLFNGLNLVPLLLIGCAFMMGRGAVARRRSLARERARARSDGEERERRRWARELHDETLQELVAVQLVLSAAAGTGRLDAMDEAIGQARSLIANQITSLRHLIVEMRPFALDQLGLAPAVETLCRRTEDTFGLDVELRVGAEWHGVEGELSPEAQAHVYRIVQEAVNNAVKHAGADRLVVELDGDEREFSVAVRDNGRGIEQRSSAPADRSALTAVVSTGTGLSAMRERGHLLDGHLDVGSAPGGGTSVTLLVPRHAGRRSGR